MSAAVSKFFAPPCDAEWAFTIAPLMKQWIALAVSKEPTVDRSVLEISPDLLPLARTTANQEMTASNPQEKPATQDLTEAFDSRLAAFKKELSKAKEIRQLDRRIKRVTAIRAQIKALVEAYHAALA
jgi:flagellar motility protein MotE (MotC chaperone)